jgi:hypothetical protein
VADTDDEDDGEESFAAGAAAEGVVNFCALSDSIVQRCSYEIKIRFR